MKSSVGEQIGVSESPLSPDVLGFQVDNLNVPARLKLRLRYELGVETVSDFVRIFKGSHLAQRGFGLRPIEQVWQQVGHLAESGGARYLKEISLETRSFLGLVRVIREELSPKDRMIFDHRLCPVGTQMMTLQELGNGLHLTRERVRQVEHELVNRLQRGSLREIGWIIQRKTLALFRSPVRQLSIQQLMMHPFFAGFPPGASSPPSPFVLIGKVFSSTFTVDAEVISLTVEALWRRGAL